jgi:two-component system OmpR family sensor kinase
LLPSLAAVAVAGFMILIAVSFGLRPLVRITSDLRTRSHRDLSPIDAERLAPDVSPVVHALNELMHRLESIIAAQRNFIADAAHELLTPLTALRLQTQMLARAESPHRQREAIRELQGGVSRTLQLARQLLALARHGADADDQPVVRVDLEQLVHNVLAIHLPLAQAKSIRTEISAQAACAVIGSEEALNTLVSNLIDNAVKYTGIGGAVRICVQPAAGQVCLDIEDSGPGIAPEERERVFDRFYRHRSNTASGSGLGLAIAREIAARRGASITLGASSALGGLHVRVGFAAPAATADQTSRNLPRVA